jgi:hypothetical protein
MLQVGQQNADLNDKVKLELKEQRSSWTRSVLFSFTNAEREFKN